MRWHKRHSGWSRVAKGSGIARTKHGGGIGRRNKPRYGHGRERDTEGKPVHARCKS